MGDRGPAFPSTAGAARRFPHHPRASMAFGVLIPEFPTQTHIAMWRVAAALRELGEDVRLLSTRRPEDTHRVHAKLTEEQARTHYVWPPAPLAVARRLGNPAAAARVLAYVRGVAHSRRTTLAGLAASAADLADHCRGERISHVLVHSCADAAHVAAMSRLLGGPRYSLRLGGDLQVYGKDHAAKMRDATVVVAAAENNREQVLREVGLPPERVITSWLGVDTRRFTPGTPRQEGAPLHLATVARLNPLKGHRFVLQALRRAIDAGAACRYTIAGAGPEEANIRAQIAQLGLSDAVTLVGPLDEARVIGLLQDSDLFALASFGLGEAAPVAVLEAMACGVVPLCTIIGGTPDMIRHGVDGALFPQQEDAPIAEWLTRLSRDRGELARMRAAARQRAVEAFDTLSVAGRIREEIRTRGGFEPASA